MCACDSHNSAHTPQQTHQIMKKNTTRIIMLGALVASTAVASAKITVKVPEGVTSVNTSSILISDYLKSGNRPVSTDNSVAVTDGVAVFEQTTEGPARYVAQITPEAGLSFFTSPGEDMTIEITSLEPVAYQVSGSPLMEGVRIIDSSTEPVYAKLRSFDASAPDYQQKLEECIKEYNSIVNGYISSNPDSPAVCYALTLLDGDDFFTGYENLTGQSRQSILFPLVQQKYEREEAAQKMQRLQKAMASGHQPAPEITLPDANGKNISLSDFRGKWVIIDFWGSWCGWCIKGFPKLKEVYEANKDKLVVFGVDNGDSIEAWKTAVEKYALPWVNVYNATERGNKDNKVLSAYGVQGFPTKVIVDPAGNVADITTGEDPSFYTRLDALLKSE